MNEPRRSSDVDLLTLTIAAVASAVAAYVTSQVWEGGTLISAALTPVIVALVKEALARPVDRIASTRTQERTPLHPPVKVHRSSGRRWKVAIISGIAAFAIVVAVFTVPELLAGKSVGRSGDSATTLFGGTKRRAAPKSPAKKDAAPTATETPTVTPTATATATVTPSATPSPTSTVSATPSPVPTAASATPSPTP